MPSPLGFAIAALQLGMQSSIPRSNRAFADMNGFITFEEVHRDVLEITDHPIEQGGVISDHAFKRPAEVVMKIGWSNSGAGGLVGGTPSSIFLGQNVRQVSSIYLDLLDLQAFRVPFNVFTGKRYYRDMLIKDITATTDPKTEDVLMATVTFRQVIITDTQTVIANRPGSGAQAEPQSTGGLQNNGTQQLQPASTVNAGAADQARNPR